MKFYKYSTSRIGYIIFAICMLCCLLQLTFSNGKPEGFSVSAFDWSKSDFSKFFNLKRVTSESEFHEAWEKFVALSLCPSTGVFSVVKARTLNGTPTTENQQVSWYR